MSLKAGIVGLPNVGKSTLFNAITQAGALAANYPFATIDPNVGVVSVPDERLNVLTRMYNPKKVIPTTYEFIDIAGLVKGASKGEGLGNQFLSHIREVDAICQVVRCFDDENVVHVEGSVNPIRDIETINLELIFSDLEVIEKRLPKIEKRALVSKDETYQEYLVLKQIKDGLLQELPARALGLSKEEKFIVKHFNFLTLKPMMYVANVSETDILDPSQNAHYQALTTYAKTQGAQVLAISAQIEAELSQLEEEERTLFLEELGVTTAGLDQLIKATYDLLGLATYLTAGEKEVRAWTFTKGMTAPQCAGIIHSDFEKGFIRAETVAYSDLVDAGSMTAAKERGKVRLEGKDYLVKDGDVLLFRFNV